MKIGLISAGVVGFLVLAGCEKEQDGLGEIRSEDPGLRALLGVSAIGGEFRAPEGKPYFRVTTLQFEDGRFVRRGSMAGNTFGNLEGEWAEAEFVWREGAAALASPGGFSREETDFWEEMSAIREFGSRVERPQFGDFEVLGFASSYEMQDGSVSETSGGFFEGAVEKRRFVGALVVAFFESEDEAMRLTSDHGMIRQRAKELSALSAR
ncbi:MAG: hypothetical protein AAGC74_10730 [Verrucomicrobiota bacterium]